MLPFLRDLFSRPGTSRTVIVMEPEAMSTPRQYEVRPGYGLLAAAGAAVLVLALVLAFGVIGPLRTFFGASSAAEMRSMAEATARRAAALEDSMSVQAEQIALLRALIAGDVAMADSLATDGDGLAVSAAEGTPEEPEADPPVRSAARPAPGPSSALALPMRTLGRGDARVAEAYLEGLRLPALPPLDGAVSRGFRPADGHFGLDLAVAEGTPVRALAEGGVVFSDWTHAGGYVIAVQHPDGYLSVYKHASQLLRRVGERVGVRDVIALSGNTGTATSGPHLHLELWRDGLAQDPATFLVRR